MNAEKGETVVVSSDVWRRASKSKIGSHVPGLLELHSAVSTIDGRWLPRGAQVQPQSGGHNNVTGRDEVHVTLIRLGGEG